MAQILEKKLKAVPAGSIFSDSALFNFVESLGTNELNLQRVLLISNLNTAVNYDVRIDYGDSVIRTNSLSIDKVRNFLRENLTEAESFVYISPSREKGWKY